MRRTVVAAALCFLAGVLVGYLVHATISVSPPGEDSMRTPSGSDRRTKPPPSGIPSEALVPEAEATVGDSEEQKGDPGGASVQAPFEVAADGTEIPVRVAGASSDPDLGMLRVFVMNRDGTPRSGVEVTATGYRMTGQGQSISVDHTGTTGVEGWAAIPDLPPLRYHVRARWTSEMAPDSITSRSAYAQVLPGRITEVSLVALRGGTLVTGRVIDSTGQKTYSGVQVGLLGNETFSRTASPRSVTTRGGSAWRTCLRDDTG